MHLPPIFAAIICLIGIAGLFWLDRDGEVRISKALLIPMVWLLLTGSRPVSMWLGVAPQTGTATIYEEGSPVDRAVFIVLEAAALTILISRAAQTGPILRKNWPILLFFFYAAFSILWSEDPFVTLKHWIKGIGDVAMVLVVLTEPDMMDAIKRLVTRVGFTLLPLSVLLCKYYPRWGRVLSGGGQMQWNGVTLQKNTLGSLCMVYGLGLLWRFCSAYEDRQDPARRRRLLAIGTVLLMTFWLLWKCRSMTSIVGLGMGGALMLLSRRPAFRRQPILVHILVVAMLSTAVYAIFFQSSGELLQQIGKDPTLTGRTAIWHAVLSVPVNPVVGVGYESFWLGRRLQDLWVRFPEIKINEAHNGYIEMYLNLGWVGIFLLGGIMVLAYRAASAALRRDPERGGLYLAWLVAAAARGVAEAAFRMMSSSWIFLLLGAMAASQATVEAYEAPDPGDLVENEAQSEFALASPVRNW
jgi:exopolysaccharide production protein ExoQ